MNLSTHVQTHTFTKMRCACFSCCLTYLRASVIGDDCNMFVCYCYLKMFVTLNLCLCTRTLVCACCLPKVCKVAVATDPRIFKSFIIIAADRRVG